LEIDWLVINDLRWDCSLLNVHIGITELIVVYLNRLRRWLLLD
jgi:hypothetical protein